MIDALTLAARTHLRDRRLSYGEASQLMNWLNERLTMEELRKASYGMLHFAVTLCPLALENRPPLSFDEIASIVKVLCGAQKLRENSSEEDEPTSNLMGHDVTITSDIPHTFILR